MNRALIIALLSLPACSGSQRLAYEGAQKGNIVVGRYFGANAKDLFHTAEQGLMHFDGSAWTQVPGVDSAQGQLVSAGAGKVWLLSSGKLERIDAAGMRQDFTPMINADGPPLSIGRGNGEVMVSTGNTAMKRFFIYRLNGETFERLAGPSSDEFSFELIRARDDAFLRAPLAIPAVPFSPVASYVATPTPLSFFDGTTVNGPISITGNTDNVGVELKSVSARVPKSEGALGAFTFDGAWLHYAGRPAPGGFYYWRADNRLGVLANLFGAADWTPTYAVGYDPATGQYGSVLLDVNSDVEVNYWTAAWDGTSWVEQQKLFKSTGCVGVTCGGSRTGFAGELDDGTMVAAGPDDSGVAGIWFVTP